MKQPIKIRIVEWEEWLPAKPTVIGRMRHPDTQELVERSIDLRNGITGFRADTNEKLVDLSVTTTQQRRVITTKNEEGDEESYKYELYLFQAVLATNNAEYKSDVQPHRDLIAKADAEQAKGRDRRQDLILPRAPTLPPRQIKRR